MRVLKLLVQRSRPPFPQGRRQRANQAVPADRGSNRHGDPPNDQSIATAPPVTNGTLISSEPGCCAEPYCKVGPHAWQRDERCCLYPVCCLVGFYAPYFDVSRPKSVSNPASWPAQVPAPPLLYLPLTTVKHRIDCVSWRFEETKHYYVKRACGSAQKPQRMTYPHCRALSTHG
jgi:hypothetical protein